MAGPEAKNEQQPEHIAFIVFARRVRGKIRFDGPGIEPRAKRGISRKNHVIEQLTAGLSGHEPAVAGHAEAHFFPVDEFFREGFFEGAFEKDFAVEFAVAVFVHAPLFGEPCGEGGDVYIQKGRANFKAVVHAGDIDLGEDCAGKIGALVHGLDVSKGIGMLNFAVGLFKEFGGCLNEVLVLGLPELAALGEGGVLDHALPFDEFVPIAAGVTASERPREAAGVHFGFGVLEAGPGEFDAGFEPIAVAVVAAEEFIAAIAGEDHGDMLAGEFGNGPGGDGGTIAEGFAVVVDEVGQFVPEIVADVIDDEGKAAFVGDGFGVLKFVVFRFIEGDAEALNGAFKDAAHFEGDKGRVDAAAEKDAEGDIGDEVGFDGVVEGGAEFFFPFFLGFVAVGGDFPLPIAGGFGDVAIKIEGDEMSGWELAHVGVDGFRRGDVLEAEEEIDGAEVNGDRCAGSANGGEFGGEGELLRGGLVEERFDAERIAGEESFARAEVNDAECEHAAETADAIIAPLFKGMDDHFGVAAGVEGVAGGFELGAELSEVVDFAVEGDPDVAVFVGHGLLACGGVDDGKAAVTEGDVGADEVSVAIGSAMGDGAGHAADGGVIRDRLLMGDDAGNAAHGGVSWLHEGWGDGVTAAVGVGIGVIGGGEKKFDVPVGVAAAAVLLDIAGVLVGESDGDAVFKEHDVGAGAIVVGVGGGFVLGNLRDVTVSAEVAERAGDGLLGGGGKYVVEVAVAGTASKEVFGVAFAGGDVEHVHVEFLIRESFGFVDAGEFHGPAAEPVADIGPVVHAAAAVVVENIAERIAAAFEVGPDVVFPRVGPFHFLFAKRARLVILAFDIEPVFGGGIDVDVGGVEGDVEDAVVVDAGGGVLDGFPHAAGVMEDAPGVDDVGVGQLIDECWIKDGALRDGPVVGIADEGAKFLCCADGVGVVIKGDDARGTGAEGGEGVEAGAAADVEEGFADEVGEFEEVEEMVLGFSEPFLGEGAFDEVGPVPAEAETEGRVGAVVGRDFNGDGHGQILKKMRRAGTRRYGKSLQDARGRDGRGGEEWSRAENPSGWSRLHGARRRRDWRRRCGDGVRRRRDIVSGRRERNRDRFCGRRGCGSLGAACGSIRDVRQGRVLRRRRRPG